MGLYVLLGSLLGLTAATFAAGWFVAKRMSQDGDKDKQ